MPDDHVPDLAGRALAVPALAVEHDRAADARCPTRPRGTTAACGPRRARSPRPAAASTSFAIRTGVPTRLAELRRERERVGPAARQVRRVRRPCRRPRRRRRASRPRHRSVRRRSSLPAVGRGSATALGDRGDDRRARRPRSASAAERGPAPRARLRRRAPRSSSRRDRRRRVPSSAGSAGSR